MFKVPCVIKTNAHFWQVGSRKILASMFSTRIFCHHYLLACTVVHNFYAGANAPTGLAAEVVGQASIRVSWTAPTSGATVTGYRIYYHEENSQGGIISPDSIDVDASTTEHNITIVLTAGHRYNITVRALSTQLPSSAVGPSTVTIGKST